MLKLSSDTLVLIAIILTSATLTAALNSKDYLTTKAVGSEPIYLHVTGSLPKGLEAKLTTTPNGPFKDGNEIKFNVRVSNKSKKSQKMDIHISLPTHTERTAIKYAELRSLSEPPTRLGLINQEDGPEVSLKTEWATYASWDNRTIPANSKKDYSITVRLFFDRSECDKKTLQGCYDTLGSFGVNIAGAGYKQSAGTTIPYSVNKIKGGVILNKKPVEHIFYAAYKRFPTAKERAVWEKKYWTYKDSDVSIKQALWYKDMLDTAKKKVNK